MIRTIIQLYTLLLCVTGYGQDAYPVTYSIPEKTETAAGTNFTITVSFTANEHWYIYAPTGDNAAQGMVETNIIYQLPKGITRKGKMQLPKSKYKGGFEVYDGKNIVFSQEFGVGSQVQAGEYIIKAKLTYQTCNEKICLPPMSEEVEVRIVVSRESGVVSQETGVVREKVNGEWSMVNGEGNGQGSIGNMQPAISIKQDSAGNNGQLELKFTSIDGRKVDITKLKGKLVLIDCWASWCRPCIAEFANLKMLYEKYKSQGFEVIGINMDEATAKQRVKDLITKNKLPWPQWMEGKGFNNNSFVKEQGIGSLPAVYLIDKNGKIIDRDARGERLEELIKENL